MEALTRRWPIDQRTFAVALLAIGLWWAAAPYRGITHDAVYYAADALRRLSGGGLADDLFFKYGSQGDYSLFGNAYAWLAKHAGIGTAAWLISLTGRLCWLAAFTWVCCTVFPRANRLWVIAVGLLMPRYFEAMGLLSYAEPFATPRTLAESAVLLSIGWAALGRWTWAGFWLLVAGALHPLMAIGGVAVAWWMTSPRLRLAIAATVIALTSLLCWAGVAPFNGLLQQYDPEWWEVVASHNPMVLASSWDLASWSRTGAFLLLLFVAGRESPSAEAHRCLALSVAYVGVLVLCCWVMVTWMRWVLPTQLQLWRAAWLAQLLGPMVWVARMPPLKQWQRAHWCEALLTGAGLLCNAWAALPLCLAGWAAGRFVTHAVPVRTQRVLLAACGLSFAMAAAVQWGSLLLEWSIISGQCSACARISAGVASPLVALGVLACAQWLIQRLHGSLAWSAGVAGALAGLLFWSVPLFTEPAPRHDPAMEASLSRLLPHPATIYWDAGARSSWLKLHMAHYASALQGGGALFSRPLALELRRRESRLAAAGFAAEQPRSRTTADDRPAAGQPTASELRVLCADEALQGVLLTGYRDDLGTRLSGQDGGKFTLVACTP